MTHTYTDGGANDRLIVQYHEARLVFGAGGDASVYVCMHVGRWVIMHGGVQVRSYAGTLVHRSHRYVRHVGMHRNVPVPREGYVVSMLLAVADVSARATHEAQCFSTYRILLDRRSKWADERHAGNTRSPR